MRIGALLGILLAARISPTPSGGTLIAAERAKSIIYLRMTDAIHLDPWQAQEVYSTEIAYNIFEGLVRFKKNSIGVEPCLSTAWTVEDGGKRWRFSLRRGVRFHDGTPFDARAVLHSFKSRSLFSFIKAVNSEGPYSIEITLDRPYAPFLVALADSTAFIVPPSAKRAGTFQPIGTGPFRFLSWTREKSLILARSPDYWGGAPRLERIVFKVMPDSPGRILQIKNGSADMTKIQSSKEYEELALRSDIIILRQAFNSTHYLGFNTRKPPFDRKEVRAAFLHIIDKGTLIKRIFQNMAEPAFSPLPRELFPEMKVRPVSSFNPKAARILLRRAGLESGFSCTLFLPEGQAGLDEVANLLIVTAKQIGITVKKSKLPFNKLMEAAGRGEHDMLLSGWSTSPDPDLFLYPLFTMSPGNRNRFFYDSPELTRLLDLGRITLDPSRREKIYIEALAVLKKDVPWIPLYHPLNITACGKRVSGLAFTPLGHVLFRQAAKETE